MARRTAYEVHSGGKVTKCSGGRLGFERARRIAEEESKANRHATIFKTGGRDGPELVGRYYEGRFDGRSA